MKSHYYKSSVQFVPPEHGTGYTMTIIVRNSLEQLTTKLAWEICGEGYCIGIKYTLTVLNLYFAQNKV